MSKTMKKILFYIHSLNKGGAERVLLTVAEELNKTEDYEPVILTDVVDELEYNLPTGIRREVIDADGYGMNSVKRIKSIREKIVKEDPDEVIVFMLSSVIRASFALIGTKYRIIGAVRSNPYDDYSTGRSRALLMWAMRGCKYMVCQTEYQVKFFPDRYRDKCVVISNPIFSEFAFKAEQLNSNKVVSTHTLGNDSESIQGKITATGRLFDYKNHKLLINAFGKIAESYPNVKVIIYGEGPYRSALESEIETLGLKDRVLLPGDSEHVSEDIADSLIYVLPSDTEGLPNALMEAMALGLPVISTDCPCGGPRSLINDGINGMLISVGDTNALAEALDKLLKDENLRTLMGNNAKNILITNSIDVIVDKWKKIV